MCVYIYIKILQKHMKIMLPTEAKMLKGTKMNIKKNSRSGRVLTSEGYFRKMEMPTRTSINVSLSEKNSIWGK